MTSVIIVEKKIRFQDICLQDIRLQDIHQVCQKSNRNKTKINQYLLED